MNAEPETVNQTHRVLIVEDNPDVADMLNLLLIEWGQETRIAYDPPKALELAEKFKPQVVLLDIGLPKMHGYALARLLREKPWGRDICIIAVTGWGQEADRQQSRAAGINHHLLKPVDPEQLRELLMAIELNG
jgi:CheY-like chemotaxis protein